MYKQENNTSILKSISLDFGTFELRSDNIMTFDPFPEITTINMNQLKVMLETLIKLSNGKPKPFLSDNRKMKSLGFEEREYVAKNIHLFAIASVVIEGSFVVRFITHTIVAMFKPQIPMKMFKTKEDAYTWLRTFNN